MSSQGTEPTLLTSAAVAALPVALRACSAPATQSKRVNSDKSRAPLTDSSDSSSSDGDSNSYLSSSLSSSSSSSDSRPPPPPKINRDNHLLPRALQDIHTDVQIAFYPASLSVRHRLPQPQDPLAPSLRTMGIEVDCFKNHPVPCPKCLKLAYSHPRRPDALFTVFFDCPHTSDVEIERLSSQSIAALLRRAGLANVPACRGNVVVFKHRAEPNSAISNADLGVIDVEEDDLLVIDQILVDIVSRLSAHALVDVSSPARVYFIDGPQAATHNLATLQHMRLQTFSWTQNEAMSSIRMSKAIAGVCRR